MLRIVTVVSFFALCHGFGNYSNYPKGLKEPVPLKTSLSAESRIIGGQATGIKNYPYSVSLQQEWEEYQYDTIHACTGTIIGEDWVLISAICAYLFEQDNITLRVGSDYFHQGGTIHQVAEVIVHPLFNEILSDYDVALLRLNKSLILSDTVQPVKLPTPNMTIPEGTNFTLASWGASYYLGDMTIQLQEITMATITKELCETVWTGRVTDQMICGYKEYVGICVGDTGTPAVADGVLIGVASYAYACMDYGYPVVFAKMPVLVEWVTEITGISSATATAPFCSLLFTVIVLLKMRLD